MVKSGIVSCSECGKEFEEGDTVVVCKECKKRFCDDCWDDHNCIDEEFDEAEVECADCSCNTSVDDSKKCRKCDAMVCDSCWDEHCHDHLDTDKVEALYEDYINDAVKEAL